MEAVETMLSQICEALKSIWFPVPRRPAALTVMALAVQHGIDFYQQDLRLAPNASDYHALGTAIDDALPVIAKVAGSERWWWPLRAHPSLALNNLSLQPSRHPAGMSFKDGQGFARR